MSRLLIDSDIEWQWREMTSSYLSTNSLYALRWRVLNGSLNCANVLTSEMAVMTSNMLSIFPSALGQASVQVNAAPHIACSLRNRDVYNGSYYSTSWPRRSSINFPIVFSLILSMPCALSFSSTKHYAKIILYEIANFQSAKQSRSAKAQLFIFILAYIGNL